MLIDIHCHTLQTKSDGESEKRNVQKELFREKIIKAKIKMLAITNHNLFDKKQFDEFKDEISKNCYLIPGIEFNLKEKEGSKPSHILVLVNPKYEDDFNNKVLSLTNPKKEPTFSINNFVITIQGLIENFKDMNPIFIPHYKKDPSITNETLAELEEKCKEKKIPVLLEPSNSKTITVLNQQHKKCIIGSDVIDWNKYEGGHFSKLLKSVYNYEQFHDICLGEPPIVLDSISESYIKKIELFKNEKSYNDSGQELEVEPGTVIIFGDKGTGKTKLLESIKSDMENKGMSCNLFASTNTPNWWKDLLKCDASRRNLNELGIGENFSEDIQAIYDFVDCQFSPINSFLSWSKANISDSKKSKIRIFNVSIIENSNREIFLDYFKDAAKIRKFCEEMRNFSIYSKKINEIEKIIKSLESLQEETLIIGRNLFIDFKSNYFIKKLKDSYDDSFLKYKGIAKHPEIGIYKYYINRINIYKKAKQIKDKIDSKIRKEKEKI